MVAGFPEDGLRGNYDVEFFATLFESTKLSVRGHTACSGRNAGT